MNEDRFARYEQKRHERHAEIRRAAQHGDGTIEQAEAELARIRAIKHRAEVEALKAENEELKRELAEARNA